MLDIAVGMLKVSAPGGRMIAMHPGKMLRPVDGLIGARHNRVTQKSSATDDRKPGHVDIGNAKIFGWQWSRINTQLRWINLVVGFNNLREPGQAEAAFE